MNSGIAKHQIAGMNLIYRWYPFEYFLDSMVELGLESISLWGGPPHFDCDHRGYPDCKEILRKTRCRGLSIRGFLVTSTNYRYQVGIEEAEYRERAFQYFCNGIYACAELGCKQMGINSGWGYGNRDRESAFLRSCDMLHRLCEVAQKQGVYIALESLKSLETNLVITLEDTKRMFDTIAHPALKIMPDTGAIVYNGERLEDWFRCFGEQIVSMHFVDGMHQAWGDGKSALDDMMETLIRHQYTGMLELETSSAKYMGNPREADRKALRVLSRFVGR